MLKLGVIIEKPNSNDFLGLYRKLSCSLKVVLVVFIILPNLFWSDVNTP
jgi:hypothetical protein